MSRAGGGVSGQILPARLWRSLAIGMGALLLGALAVGIVAFKHRRDLGYLLSQPADARPSPKRPPLEAVPPPPEAPSILPAPAPPRELSWAGLSVAPYQGRHRGEYEVRRAADLLDQEVLEAVKDLKDLSGLFPTARDVVVFTPADASDCSFGGPYGISPGGAPAAGEAAVVSFPLEPLILGWYPARQLLAAALAETILAREAPGYAGAPGWLRRGLALHFSGFGETLERRLLAETEAPPLHSVRPLKGAGEGWLAGYWAVRALEGRQGKAAVQALADALRFTPDWEKALAAVGESPGPFEAAYEAWAKARVKDVCANRDELLGAVDLLRREDERSALAVLLPFTKDQPLDLYAGDAAYFLGYAHYRLGEHDRAIYVLTDLLSNNPSWTTRQGKAHFFLGRCYQAKGYKPLAAEHFRLARLDPGSQLLRDLAEERLKEVE